MGFRPVQKHQRAGGPFARANKPEVHRADQVGRCLPDKAQKLVGALPTTDPAQPQRLFPTTRLDHRVAGVPREQFVQRPKRLRRGRGEWLCLVPGDEIAQPISKLSGPRGNAVERPLIVLPPEPRCDVRRDHIRLLQPIYQVSPIPQPLDRDALWRGDAVQEVERRVVGDEERGRSVRHRNFPVKRLHLY
jgi:hypothetical protein